MSFRSELGQPFNDDVLFHLKVTPDCCSSLSLFLCKHVHVYQYFKFKSRANKSDKMQTSILLLFLHSDYWSYQNFSSHLIPYYECQSDGNNKKMEINVNSDFRQTKKHYDTIFKILRSCTTCSTLYNHVFTLCSVLAFIKCIYFFILITSCMVSLFFW